MNCDLLCSGMYIMSIMKCRFFTMMTLLSMLNAEAPQYIHNYKYSYFETQIRNSTRNWE